MTEDIAYISEKIDLCFNMHDKIIQAIRLDRSDNFPKSITDETLSLYQETKKTIATSLIPEQLKKDTIGIISADLKIFKADLNAPICDRKQFLEKRVEDSMQS